MGDDVSTSPWFRSTPKLALLGLVVLGTLLPFVLVLWSPFALRALDDRELDWERLSSIAQTYAAASAILSAAAIAGVAASLLLQAREMKINRTQAQRQFHMELLKMAMTEPVLLECWGEVALTAVEPSRANQLLYTNLIFAHWEMMFRLGDLTEDQLREECRVIFSGEPARRYWAWAVAGGMAPMHRG